MTGGMRIDCYGWSGGNVPGGREAMVRFGTGTPRVILALPLFEEYNRTRAFAVGLLRGLAARGIAGLLPDWPGTGDSAIPTSEASLTTIRHAFAALAGNYAPLFAVGIRSGALLDAAAAVQGRWHLSPQSGDELVRELTRQTSPEGDIAGNLVSPGMVRELAVAQVGEARVVRLDSDPRPGDRSVPGAPLWRRSEPGDDPALAAVLVEDIARWIAACGG